jgi:uncharacterized protein with HEPN domain
MKRDDSIYLQHIMDAINRIEEYLEEVNEVAFFENHLVQDGVIRQLEIVGEAVKQLSSDLRVNSDDIPWQDIAGMRDKLIHHYFGVDLGSVLRTAKEDLPILKKEILLILDKEKRM